MQINRLSQMRSARAPSSFHEPHAAGSTRCLDKTVNCLFELQPNPCFLEPIVARCVITKT